ncbi:hypothetical protein Tco_1450468 [Tanacetum coccineum]
MAKVGKPPTTFDELMSTPINFSAYVFHNLKIENLTQEHLVGPTFNLLKGTFKIRVELEFHFEECYKAVTDKLDWTNPEVHEYPFELSKLLPLIEDQGRQVVPANYFFNNNLKYLKDQQLYKFVEGDLSRLIMRDIKDMLLLLVQKKLSNLERDDIFDLNVALRMFTRRVVILKRVKDLQLGVESYQKNLNITRPETFTSDITKMTPYTTYNNP